MSMIPFFPSLTPPIASSLWFNVDIPCDDEAEVAALETENQIWLSSITLIGVDLYPLGKVSVEHLDGPDTDDDDANDDSDDSESHDDEDDEEPIDQARARIDRDHIDAALYSPISEDNNITIQHNADTV